MYSTVDYSTIFSIERKTEGPNTHLLLACWEPNWLFIDNIPSYHRTPSSTSM
jgi:hypothetical protein